MLLTGPAGIAQVHADEEARHLVADLVPVVAQTRALVGAGEHNAETARPLLAQLGDLSARLESRFAVSGP
jgi:hypothetical protein